MLVVCLGEEIGWRGFAVPQLMEGTGNFILAGLVSAILWGAWHLCTLNYAYVWHESGMLWFNLIIFFLGWIGISFVFCWLRLASGSIWPCLLLHTVMDTGYIGPILMTERAVPGAGVMVIAQVHSVLVSFCLAAIVIWYVRGHPIVPEHAGEAS